jgi:hypothetical protein
MYKPVLAFFLSALCLLAADVAGKWTGTLRFEGVDNSAPAVLILKQEGNTVTGTGGPDESQQHPFENGKIEGNNIHLERHAGENDVITIELKLENDQLVGNMKMVHGADTRNATLSLKRSKS